MLDFMMVATRKVKSNIVEVYPKFKIKKSSDLMIRGGDFYAIWVEETKLWSTDEDDVVTLVDIELKKAKEKLESDPNNEGMIFIPKYMWDASSGTIDAWHKYCTKQLRDSYHMLDETLIFSNTETTKEDYASKKLSYPLEEGPMPGYDRLMSKLYSKEDRSKIEWAIGAIVSGDSRIIQKFLVLYGAAGTGKSTILNIIQDLFEGYYSVFDAKALGSSNNSFALESFKSNPLVAIQHDGDLSRIEDNTRLNSLVSHEMMTVNEKFKSAYTNRFKSFLFMGTNKPVKITDGRSGLIRRLIDVSPSGHKLTNQEYNQSMREVKFELGAIAYHCLNFYNDNKHIYDDYIPIAMLGASNDFYNFMEDCYHIFKKDNAVTLKIAWEMYKTYNEEANVLYPLPKRAFKEELRNYFWKMEERHTLEDGTRARNYFYGFRIDKFEPEEKVDEPEPPTIKIEFKEQASIFDELYVDSYAQYASDKEAPYKRWDDVKTKLSSIDTSKLHYVRVPENHIVIDFDITDSQGNKNFELNLKEASKWPTTYAEISKGGNGIHLHYIYTGDVNKLSRVYSDQIEVKIFNGKSSLRRKLSKCNAEKIRSINSGLPTKGDKMINSETIKSEMGLRTLIKRNLNKEIHPGTKPSIDFIYKILDDAYESGMIYDVSNLRGTILAFASQSTHQADYCLQLANKMKYQSEEQNEDVNSSEAPIVFYDVEVFPNLFLVNWKKKGTDKVIRMINPSAKDIEALLKFRLIGFNCRRYDNHILYAALMGYSNIELYRLSQKIVTGSKNPYFSEAYNLSYTDVYDFSAKKQSLKKFEIELGIHHKELGLPWDKPVPENKWPLVAEYCDNDVVATEETFNAREADFIAREILAELAGGTVNDTTNSLTTKIIFGKERKPQNEFNYRKMGDTSNIKEGYIFEEPGMYENIPNDLFDDPDTITEKAIKADIYNIFDIDGRPYFPGYEYAFGKSTYRGEVVGEGGYVYAEPGMYTNVALLDVESMHPTSAVVEKIFGKRFTKRFEELLEARLHIKHKRYDEAKKLFDGKLSKYLDDEKLASALSYALKIAINSVYGLTSAKFKNAFKDDRNIDNMVAKRGALFMINLKHEVQKRGFTVAHIKTDSIKIPDATPEIIKFVFDYGKEYGYNFEHEETYDKMCLVNDAVYIAKHHDKWTATGTQFQVPYVFKKLFSKEKIEFDDMCETKSVTGALYLDMNEDMGDCTDLEKELKKIDAYLKKHKWSYTAQDSYSISTEVEYGRDIYNECKRLHDRKEEITKELDNYHNYIFIGRIGRFCPVKDGTGGGLLMREKDGKYYAATGTKGYRWLESEHILESNKQDCVDTRYYDHLVDEAVKSLSKYGDVEWFLN